MEIGDLVELRDGSVGLIVAAPRARPRPFPSDTIRLVQWLSDGVVEDVAIYDHVEVISEHR
jgi:hypothetical protein